MSKPAPKVRKLRRKNDASGNVRYFVGHPTDGGGDGKPNLEQEVASEPESIITAFKNDSRLYLVQEYRVVERIEGNEVRLQKQSVTPAKRVSTANAS